MELVDSKSVNKEVDNKEVGHQEMINNELRNIEMGNTEMTNDDSNMDLEGDKIDAKWFARTEGTSGAPQGVQTSTDKDATHYNMTHQRRGRAFIFNHMHFDQLNKRNGTNQDMDNLWACLNKLKFEVEVHEDLPFRDIDKILEKASLEDHSDADCILVFVLSHGELGILHARDQPYKPDRLWSRFSADKFPSLAGKPKLFFIQACQGEQLDRGVKVAPRTDTDGAATYKVPVHADFLISYSTIPGFYSWRNTAAGTWFVQAFCHVLQTEVESLDLLSLMTRVSRKVALDFQSNVPRNMGMHEMKQVPCVISMLTRDIVFNKK